MSKEKDRIVKFTGEEIEINDNQKKPIDDELIPPIDENIDALYCLLGILIEKFVIESRDRELLR